MVYLQGWNVKQLMLSHCTLPALHCSLRQQHARCQYGTWTLLGSVRQRGQLISASLKNQIITKQKRLILEATAGRCLPETCRPSPSWGPPHFAGWFHCTQSPLFVFQCLEQQTAPAPEKWRKRALIPRAPALLRHCWERNEKRLLPGCESGTDRYWLSTRSSSSGTGRTWGAPLAACCGAQRLLLEPRSGWTWRCCWTRPAVGAFA